MLLYGLFFKMNRREFRTFYLKSKFMSDLGKNKKSVEDSKQRATCEDLLYICTRVRQTIY